MGRPWMRKAFSLGDYKDIPGIKGVRVLEIVGINDGVGIHADLPGNGPDPLAGQYGIFAPTGDRRRRRAGGCSGATRDSQHLANGQGVGGL